MERKKGMGKRQCFLIISAVCVCLCPMAELPRIGASEFTARPRTFPASQRPSVPATQRPSQAGPHPSAKTSDTRAPASDDAADERIPAHDHPLLLRPSPTMESSIVAALPYCCRPGGGGGGGKKAQRHLRHRRHPPPPIPHPIPISTPKPPTAPHRTASPRQNGLSSRGDALHYLC
ncbi:hypothetical protein BS50DRAFT_392800 [Corynespora cassiicola Philippines]|uniref:Uncharacterized protein n=1 Tax=Corynespora cassiicola Philippines TaxID=1448308 RepID=A0A2T2NPY2_CORCC|nr:hypothetical protein BS50DRAFT_392800 [Corynespora cassiicola Philippines]